jgi:hypothetical protein
MESWPPGRLVAYGWAGISPLNFVPLFPANRALYNSEAVTQARHGLRGDVGIEDTPGQNRALGWAWRNRTQSDGG